MLLVSQVCHSLGWAMMKNSLIESSQTIEQHFERAIVIDPVGPPAAVVHVALGRLAVKQGNCRFADAYACFQKALALLPGYAPAHYYAGRLFWQHRRSEESIEHFQAALQCSDRSQFRSKVRRALTLSLLDIGRTHDAKLLAQAEAAETEAAMAMHRCTLGFVDQQMEEDFNLSRATDKAWTTRLVLLLAWVQMVIPLLGFIRDPAHVQKYTLLYFAGLLLCMLSLAGTFHRRFWAVKGLCCTLSIAAIIGIQLANLILLLKDSEQTASGVGSAALDFSSMRKELVQAIMTFHLHFCLLFICPQLFGLNWLTMSSAVLLLLAVLVAMWVSLPAAQVYMRTLPVRCVRYIRVYLTGRGVYTHTPLPVRYSIGTQHVSSRKGCPHSSLLHVRYATHAQCASHREGRADLLPRAVGLLFAGSGDPLLAMGGEAGAGEHCTAHLPSHRSVDFQHINRMYNDI